MAFRVKLSLALLVMLSGAVARAEDTTARAEVTAATVYLSGADVTRVARADLPAGRHRVLVPLPGAEAPPDVSVDGARLAEVSLLRDAALAFDALDTAEQSAARATVEAAAAATRDARQAVATARADAQAARTRLRWIATLTGGGEGGLGRPETVEVLSALLDTLGEATRAAAADEVAAEAAVEIAERALRERQADERRARDALARLFPYTDATPVLALTMEADTPGPVTATLRSRDPAASWSRLYDLSLDTDAGTVALIRRARVRIGGPGVWRDVALTLSTDAPRAVAAPTQPVPDPARIASPVALEDGPASPSLARTMAEAATAPLAGVVRDRLAVRYVLPDPVTLRPGAEAALALPPIDLPAEIEIRATPRRDATAFLVARIENPTAEPLPQGPATLVRDGARVGETVLPLLAPGADAEVGFGALDTLRLRWIERERGEGGDGVFRREDTLRERLAFEVENTGDGARAVLVLHALPFAEQEDVTVTLRADPPPDLRDWRDRRGVAGWRMDVAPGETRRVTLDVLIEWPEGAALDWRP